MVAWLKPITLRDSRGGSWLRYPDRRDRDPLPQPLSGPGRPCRPAPVPAHRADSHTTPRRTTRRNVPSTGNFKNPRIPISIEQLNVVTPGELRPGPCVDLTCGRSRTPARRGTRTPDPSPWPCVPRPRSRPPHGGRPRSARRHLPVEEQDAAPVLAPRPTLGCLLPFAPSIRHGARMKGVAALHHRHVPQRARAGEAAPRGAPPRTKGPAGAGAQVRRPDARRRGQTPGGVPSVPRCAHGSDAERGDRRHAARRPAMASRKPSSKPSSFACPCSTRASRSSTRAVSARWASSIRAVSARWASSIRSMRRSSLASRRAIARQPSPTIAMTTARPVPMTDPMMLRTPTSIPEG